VGGSHGDNEGSAGQYLCMSTSEDTLEFTRCWVRDGPRVAAYARRHVAADDVQDVVAETFLLAWRRWEVVPEPPIAWLIASARKVIGNQLRGAGRRHALRERLALLDAAAGPAADAGMVATERVAALERLAALPDDQREALLLVAWDGLTPAEAAVALGIRGGTLRARTHRARRALERMDTTQTSTAATIAATLTEGGIQ
jgi:RNA polymerase sigma factor (sigma-70 family)